MTIARARFEQNLDDRLAKFLAASERTLRRRGTSEDELKAGLEITSMHLAKLRALVMRGAAADKP
jgi:hypothetical protein